MKHPSKTFLQKIASRYRQISAHNVEKNPIIDDKISLCLILAKIIC